MRLRERFARHGPAGLGDDALLALIIGTGSGQHKPLDTARRLLATFGSLSDIAAVEVAALTAQPGIGLARAVQLKASLEAGRRALLDTAERPELHSAADAYHHLRPLLAGQQREHLAALYVSHGRRLLAARILTIGNAQHTIVDPRQVYRPAIQLGAAGVIISHNHPSGDPTPSAADLAVTRRLVEVGVLVGIELLDHLIIGTARYVSLAAQGALPRRSLDRRAEPSPA